MKTTIALLSLVVAACSFAGSENATNAASAPPPDLVYAGAKPIRSFLGGYPVLTRSIRSGHTSIDLDSIRSYGNPTPEFFQGQIYWSVPVTYTRRTHLNGYHVVDARALVKDDRVIHWLYSAKDPTRSSVPVN